VIISLDSVHVDPKQIDPRTVQHYVRTDTQVWYAEPITTVRKGGEYYANGAWSHSQVEACRQLGYKDLLVIYVDVSR
jgi:hypothetical protein